MQDVLALIDDAFAGVQRDESCTIHQAPLADETLDREIPDDEWLMAKRRDPEAPKSIGAMFRRTRSINATPRCRMRPRRAGCSICQPT